MKPVSKTIELATLSSIVSISILAGLAYFKIHDIAQSSHAIQQTHVGTTQIVGSINQVSPGEPGWKELSIAQRKALQPLLSQWDKLDAIDQAKWLKIANRYGGLKPEQQKRIQKRMESWAKFSQEQKQIARLNYSQTKKINIAQKSKQWELYQQLPTERKRLLASGVPFQLAAVHAPRTLSDTINSATAENVTASTEQSTSSASQVSDTEISASLASHAGMPAVAK